MLSLDGRPMSPDEHSMSPEEPPMSPEYVAKTFNDSLTAIHLWQDPTDLTALQRARSIMFTFVDVSSFDVLHTLPSHLSLSTPPFTILPHAYRCGSRWRPCLRAVTRGSTVRQPAARCATPQHTAARHSTPQHAAPPTVPSAPALHCTARVVLCC